MEKKNNKVSAKANEILANAQKAISGLINTNKGTTKESIYKSEIFDGMNDKEKKVIRRKIRKYVQSVFESLINTEDKAKQEKLAKEFIKFYVATYRVNDYSFASVSSENANDTKKETIKKALKIIASFVAKEK